MFDWCEPVQVLVRPDVVIENPEFIERALQCTTTWDDELLE